MNISNKYNTPSLKISYKSARREDDQPKHLTCINNREKRHFEIQEYVLFIESLK